MKRTPKKHELRLKLIKYVAREGGRKGMGCRNGVIKEETRENPGSFPWKVSPSIIQCAAFSLSTALAPANSPLSTRRITAHRNSNRPTYGINIPNEAWSGEFC